MTSRRKPVLLALLLVLTMPLAGCAGLTDGDTDDDGEPTPDVDGEQLRAASLDAMERVETVRITQDLQMDLGGESFTVESEGVTDLDAEKMRLTTTSSAGGSSFEQEQYLVGDTMYMHSKVFDGWVKQNISGFNAWGSNQFAQQERLLGNASLDVTGQQTVDGNEVYVTELAIDGETFTDIAAQQSSEALSQLQSNVSFDDVTITQHIDVETSRVRYTKVQYSLTLQSQEANFTLEQRFSEFNEPVDIELPEGAKSASPIGDAFGGDYSAVSA